MKALVYGTKWKPEDDQYIQGLFTKLDDTFIDFRVFGPFAEQIPSGKNFDTISDHKELKLFSPDVIITLGGDGTILSAVTLIRELEIPIMGINLGRLGFLASIEQERINEAIDLFVKSEYTISERSMIGLYSEPNIFGEDSFALNDFTLLKRDNSSMIVIHTFIDGEFLNSYWADGLIVSTPTGSTGYSLSCGGPIMFPTGDNLILTPVAPHNLNVRPFVVPSSKELTFQFEGRSDNFLCTLDSRYKIISDEYKIAIRRNPFSTKLISLKGDNFMKTIRNKLNWGLDKRN